MTDPKTPDQITRVPADIADEMVRRLFADGDPCPEDRILFPGVGHGNLIDAVVQYCGRHDTEFPESVALEINEELVNRVRQRFTHLPLDVLLLDFLDALPELGEFEYVVGDPPVSRLYDISPELREDLAMRFDTISADEPGRDEDLYLAFFEQGLRVLAPKGRLVFVTPDFTNRSGESAIPDFKRRLATFHIEDIDESTVGSEYDEINMDVVITTVARVTPNPEYASKVDFDGVQEAITVPYDIDVTSVMTEDPMSFYPDDNVHNVFLALVRNDYDAAPVRERNSENCVGLVSKADLTGADTGTLDDGYIKAINESRLLPVTASFEETVNRLRNHRFCLVGSEDDVRGIATRFDLNSMEVYFDLYAKFARFEIGLRNLIRDYEINWEDALDKGGVPQRVVDKRKEMYNTQSEVARDVFDTLLLSDLIKIVENSKVLAEAEFESRKRGIRLQAINNLRAAVAHYQPLIHTLDAESFTKQRTVRNFGDIYEALNDHLQELERGRYVR